VVHDERELNVPEQRRMFDAFAAQIALALERVHYVDIARDALVNMESERLRNSLLSAISHDLRTPLTTIVGFSSMLAQTWHAQAAARMDAQGGAAADRPAEALADVPADASAQARQPGAQSSAQSGSHPPALSAAQRSDELVDAIHEEALRMTGIVTNLLDMARLQAGSLQLNQQWTLLEETVGAALRACKRVLAGHPVQVTLAADLPLLHLDAVLMERLFSNLFENAAKYTAAGIPLTIGAQQIDADGAPFVRVTVDDDGLGLPAGMEARVFEKFTRGEKESAKPGIGLGLAICRAIVEAHGGTIGAFNRVAGDGRVEGARFWFTLPVKTPPDAPDTLEEDESAAIESHQHEGVAEASAHATSADARTDLQSGGADAADLNPDLHPLVKPTHE
jgi:two-component system sensor histidine kinase KdpD